MSAAVFVNHGISSILAPDCDRPMKPASSLRRTLSADMLSRKWMALNGLASPPEGHSLIEEEKGESEFETRNSLSDTKVTVVEEQKQTSIWSSILSEKTEQRAPPAAPYVHPLVKRSMSTLSEMSLLVCTESLGSETGSDGFSLSESCDVEEETDSRASCSSIMIGKKRQRKQLDRSKSFPPPLPSLSRPNGASLHVRSRRDNGRLVLEAVSVKEHNNFRAQREDGRLVLTFVNDVSNDHDGSVEIPGRDDNDIEETSHDSADSIIENDYEEVEDVDTEETEEALEKIEVDIDSLPKLPGRELSVNKFTILMNKPVVLANKNPILSDKFSKVVFFRDAEDDTDAVKLSQLTRLQQEIPKAATATATLYSNTYDHFWRSKSAALMSPTAEHPIIIKSYANRDYIISKDTPTTGERQDMLVLRGTGPNGEVVRVPLIRNCKDTRSLVFLGPRCVATS